MSIGGVAAVMGRHDPKVIHAAPSSVYLYTALVPCAVVAAAPVDEIAEETLRAARALAKKAGIVAWSGRAWMAVLPILVSGDLQPEGGGPGGRQAKEEHARLSLAGRR